MMLSLMRKVLAFLCLASPALGFAPTGLQSPLLGGKSAFFGLKAASTLSEEIPSGWQGGFRETNSSFWYPEPDLSALPMQDNMANIEKITRQMSVQWPQFSWVTEPGKNWTRVYQCFQPDISRLGYDDAGRVWSIICPQKGYGSWLFGTLNVEITVTGQRGWCDEPNKNMYAEMTVLGQIWMTPGFVGRISKRLLNHKGFPFSKENAIQMTTHRMDEPDQPIFRMFRGVDSSFHHPDFVLHHDEAYGVSHLKAQIGSLIETGDENVDAFNRMLLGIFNSASGNILLPGSVLTWNVWYAKPEHANQDEWRAHAEKWRTSLQVNHCPPGGPPNPPQFHNGRQFRPFWNKLRKEIRLMGTFIFWILSKSMTARLLRYIARRRREKQEAGKAS